MPVDRNRSNSFFLVHYTLHLLHILFFKLQGFAREGHSKRGHAYRERKRERLLYLLVHLVQPSFTLQAYFGICPCGFIKAKGLSLSLSLSRCLTFSLFQPNLATTLCCFSCYSLTVALCAGCDRMM